MISSTRMTAPSEVCSGPLPLITELSEGTAGFCFEAFPAVFTLRP